MTRRNSFGIMAHKGRQNSISRRSFRVSDSRIFEYRRVLNTALNPGIAMTVAVFTPCPYNIIRRQVTQRRVLFKNRLRRPYERFANRWPVLKLKTLGGKAAIITLWVG